MANYQFATTNIIINSNIDANCKLNVNANVENTEINKISNGQISILNASKTILDL